MVIMPESFPTGRRKTFALTGVKFVSKQPNTFLFTRCVPVLFLALFFGVFR